MSPETLLPLPPILNAAVFGTLIWWVALALGRRALRVLRIGREVFSSWERGLLSATFGIGLLQFLPLTLGLLHVMTPANVRIAFAVLALLLARDLWGVAKQLLQALKRLRLDMVPKAAWPWVAACAALFAVLLVRCVVFRSGGDDDGYHLAAPKRWLQSGGIDYLPTYTHTNASFGFEMSYIIALSLGDVVSAKMLHYVAGVLSLLGMVLCGRRLGSALAGLTAGSLIMVATPVFDLQPLFGVALVDFAASLTTLASLLCFLAWREERQGVLLTCLALCVGFTGAFKFTALAVVFVWVPIIVIDERGKGASWARCSSTIVRFGALAALPVLPWFLKNFLATGNPVYPMFASIVPTRDWSAEHAQVFSRYVRLYSWGIAQGANLSEAKRKLLIVAAQLVIAVGGGVAVVLVRRHVLRAMLGFAVVYIIISLQLTGLIFRYWLPATMFALLALALWSTESWSSKPWRYWPATGLLAIACVQAVAYQGVSAFPSNVKIALGLRSFSDEYPNDPFWKVWHFINSQTAPGDKVLAAGMYNSVGASSFGGFWSDRMFYTTDSHLQAALRLDTWPSFVASLKSLGVTHVMLYSKETLPRRQGFDFLAGRNEYPFSRRLADQYGEKLYEEDGLQLYRVFVDPLQEPRRVAAGPR
jgi:hypothetical protein